MTYARKSLVSLNDTPYYHVIARCVRRAWLWGFDEYAGRDYSHRKEWVLEPLAQLSSIFTIDICKTHIRACVLCSQMGGCPIDDCNEVTR